MKARNYLIIVSILLLNVCFPFTAANASLKNDGRKQGPFFQCRDISFFPAWLSDQLIHSRVPFDVNLLEADSCLSKIAYSDTIEREMRLDVKFTVNTKGKMENCLVNCNEDEELENEIRRIVLTRKKWKTAKQNGKKIDSNEHFTIPVVLEGNVVILEKGPVFGKMDRKNYGKGYNVNRYIQSIAKTIYRFHRNNADKFRTGTEIPDHYDPISGVLELSFVIHKDGYFSDLKYTNNLFPVNFAWFLNNHIAPAGRGLFSHEVKWDPAILQGEPVSVQVKAVIDYDKKEFSWNCFLMDEKR